MGPLILVVNESISNSDLPNLCDVYNLGDATVQLCYYQTQLGPDPWFRINLTKSGSFDGFCLGDEYHTLTSAAGTVSQGGSDFAIAHGDADRVWPTVGRSTTRDRRR